MKRIAVVLMVLVLAAGSVCFPAAAEGEGLLTVPRGEDLRPGSHAPDGAGHAVEDDRLIVDNQYFQDNHLVLTISVLSYNCCQQYNMRSVTKL